MEAGFRPAPLRRAQRFRLESGRLSEIRPDGAVAWSLNLEEVDRAVFVDLGAARRPIRRLDLFARGTRRRIAINAAGGAGAMAADMAAFLRLAEGTCRELAETRPGSRVEIGEYGAARWTLFALALLMLAGGGGILAAALAGGVSAERLTAAAVPVGLLILTGTAIGWANRPGAPQSALPAEALARTLRHIRGAETPRD